MQNKCDAHFAKFRITIFGAVMMLKKCYEVTKAQRAKKSGENKSHMMSYFLPSFFISKKKATGLFLVPKKMPRGKDVVDHFCLRVLQLPEYEAPD